MAFETYFKEGIICVGCTVSHVKGALTNHFAALPPRFQTNYEQRDWLLRYSHLLNE